jgi:lysophospholipid acyltransferase (LPLAT)-like uncharacterized protein
MRKKGGKGVEAADEGKEHSSVETLPWRTRLRDFFLSALICALFRTLRATWKLEEAEYPPEVRERLAAGRPVVFAHWHEDEWALLGFYARRGMTVMVSLSRDGSLMASFLSRLGFRIARGSSSRNAVGGFLALKRVVEESADGKVSLAVDGPRGPRHRVKRGVFKLADILEAPVLAGAAAADKAWVFRKSWSKAFVPKPFARVRLSYAPVLPAAEIRKNAERDDYTQLEWALEERLKACKADSKLICGVE